MAIKRVLDLNTAQRPTLELTLADDACTALRVGMPKEADIRELQAMDVAGIESGDKDAIDEAYDLAARFISCNRESVKVTGEELRGKYGMDIDLLIVFFDAYTDFISAISNEKN